MKHRLGTLFNKQNRFRYGTCMLIILAVLSFIISFLPSDDGGTSSSAEIIMRNSKPQIEESTVGENSMPITAKTFIKNGYYNVNQLVGQYYSALMANDDVKISKYTDSVENIDPLKRKINAQYIESYIGLDCYTMEGMLQGTYIVVARYQVKYKGISTITSYLDYFYICTDISGNIYITNKDIGGEIAGYNELMYEDNTIKELSEYVAKEYDAALKADPQLAEFVNNIKK